MTSEQLVLSICASINDVSEEWKNRIRSKIAMAVVHILSKYQWEFLIRYTTFLTAINGDGDRTWCLLPDTFQKEIALRRDDLDNPIDYITPSEYSEFLSESDTPRGEEASKYTVMGDETDLKRKRIYFLDVPTSDLIIKLTYSVKTDNISIENIPNEFLPVIEAYIIFSLTPPMLSIGGTKQPNPSYPYAKDHYRETLTELIAYDEAQRGRPTNFTLDKASERARKHFHP